MRQYGVFENILVPGATVETNTIPVTRLRSLTTEDDGFSSGTQRLQGSVAFHDEPCTLIERHFDTRIQTKRPAADFVIPVDQIGRVETLPLEYFATLLLTIVNTDTSYAVFIAHTQLVATLIQLWNIASRHRQSVELIGKESIVGKGINLDLIRDAHTDNIAV